MRFNSCSSPRSACRGAAGHPGRMDPRRTFARVLSPLLIGSLLAGCIGPYSKRYAPAGAAEEELFSKARRDVYPDDVRSNLAGYESETVLWTGIVRQVDEVEPGKYRLVVEHHYWDWIEDYSVQKEIAFLSPHGEGQFECRFAGKEAVSRDQIARVADMAIVYGVPRSVGTDGTVVMTCPFWKTLRRELYATDIFEYGRNGADLKVLRVPGVGG